MLQGQPIDTVSRPCKSVKPPYGHLLNSKTLFDPVTNLINIRKLEDHLLREGRLDISDVLLLLSKSTQLFSTEPNLLKLPDDVVIVGDVHGVIAFIFFELPFFTFFSRILLRFC